MASDLSRVVPDRRRRCRRRSAAPRAPAPMRSSPARLVVLLLLAVAAFPRAADAAQDCSALDCNGRGTCEPGPPPRPGQRRALDAVVDLPWTANETSASSTWDVHCDCDPGWTGLRCDREYVGCGDWDYDDEEDVEHSCYHGGSCLEGTVDSNGKVRYHCDCTDAVDENGTKYAGKYCEHAETEACPGSDEFCVNGGRCKADAARETYPCNCDGTHREGPHCEYNIGEAPDCSSFDCNDRGTCRPGVQNYNDAVLYFEMMSLDQRDDRHDDFRHCVCDEPSRYRGVHCEVEAQVCDSETTCYNGGACTRKPGGTDHHCDCSSAATETESYAGRYCEHVSTGFCTRGADHNGNSFCVNGGECGEESHEDCSCPDGYAGPLCEFVVGEPEDEDPKLPKPPECDLECFHGGNCRFGPKDFGPLEDVHALDKILEANKNIDMHCVCPEGYSGIQCDFKMELCGKGMHVCLNGSECVEKEDGKHGCDCGPAGDDFASYAGLSCEYQSTMFCGFDKATSFCTNDGKCKAKGLHWFPGCECEDGFEGERCEYKEGHAPKPEVSAKQEPPAVKEAEEPKEMSEGGKPPQTAFAIAIFFSSVAIVIGLALLFATRHSMKWAIAEREAREAETAMGVGVGTAGFDPAGVGFNTPGKEEEKSDMELI